MVGLILALCVFAVLPSVAGADLSPKELSWPEDDVVYGEEYAYIVTDGQATILDYYGGGILGSSGVLALPDRLGGYPVTAIGEQAFAANFVTHRLTGLDIPDGVLTIGDYAFYYLQYLTGISIPDSVTTIGNGAFLGCSGLADITIPDGVTNMGEYAFESCSGLTGIALPNRITAIEPGAFYNCKALAGVTIPDGVTTIGYSAFWNCSMLHRIAIPDSVTAIGDSAFEGCSSLSSVAIPPNVTHIGSKAFWNCSSLDSVTIPPSVVFIGDDAFIDCKNLILTVSQGSYAARYAEREGIPYTCAGANGLSGQGFPPEPTELPRYIKGAGTDWIARLTIAAEEYGVPVTDLRQPYSAASDWANNYEGMLADTLIVRVFANAQGEMLHVELDNEPVDPDQEDMMRAAITAMILASDPGIGKTEAEALTARLCVDYASLIKEPYTVIRREVFRGIPYDLIMDGESYEFIPPGLLRLSVGNDREYVPVPWEECPVPWEEWDDNLV